MVRASYINALRLLLMALSAPGSRFLSGAGDTREDERGDACLDSRKKKKKKLYLTSGGDRSGGSEIYRRSSSFLSECERELFRPADAYAGIAERARKGTARFAPPFRS